MGLISIFILASDRLSIDSIVLPVGTDESHVNNTVRIVYPDHDSILVPCAIENDPTILQYARVAYIALDIRWRRPVRFPRLLIPRQKRLSSVGKFRLRIEESLQRSQRDDAHAAL